jgi:sporulation protein YlmC with PRC-barrel domain
MNVQLGQRVVTRDGKNLGHIKFMIFDPEQETVKSIVVEKGLLLKDDVEIPTEELSAAKGEELICARSAAEVEDLPRFHEDLYTVPPEGIFGTAGVPAGALWPAAYPPTGYVGGYPYQAAFPAFVLGDPNRPPDYSEEEAIHRRLDQENAVIKAGDKVVASDGETVGEVVNVLFQAETGRPLRLVVRKGFLFTEDAELPGEVIAGVDDGVVYLNVDAQRAKMGVGGAKKRAA